MQSIFPKLSYQILEEIRKAECIAVVSHKNPDGDALCSSLAMREIAKALSKDCILLNDGPYKRKELDFLTKDFLSAIPKAFKERNPLVIVLDCSTIDRPGEVYKEIADLKTIVIDHHSSGTLFVPNELAYIAPNSPSTTLLVEELREALGVKLTKEMATYLYIGLATDTGFFHFLSSETAPFAFYKASTFSSVGVNPYEIYDILHDGKTLEELKYISSIIENAELYYNGALALLSEPEQSTFSGVSDIIYQEMLTVEGVKAIVFIKPKEDCFELGFRAKRDSGVDVGSIAATLGGGGHKLAAGAAVKIDRNEIIPFVVDIFKEIF